MKDFIRPLNKTIYGRIQRANLSELENGLRKYIVNSYLTTGKSPNISQITKDFLISELETLTILDKLKNSDIINFKNNQILCSYPFSDKQTDFLVKLQNNININALCATDAFGIHFLSKQNCTIITKCPDCQTEIIIELIAEIIEKQKPEGIVEFVSLPENCDCTSTDFCPTIKFFCSRDHINKWKKSKNYDFNGEIYELSDVLYHSKQIFADLLII